MPQTWEKGVELELHGIGKYRNVTSTEEAARHLLGDEWPDHDSPALRSAKRAILRAMEQSEDRLAAARARRAFIRAAEDANIYIRNK